MGEWIAENWGTVAVSLALAAGLCAIVAKLLRDRRRGRSSCGCGCGGCAMKDACHKSKGT